MPGDPCPGGVSELRLAKLLALIVAPSIIERRSLVSLISPPLPRSTMALENKPLAPKSLAPISSILSASISKIPALPSP
ncbi:MAG: hypothetical protein ACRDBG_28175 [Waterburya sp.]